MKRNYIRKIFAAFMAAAVISSFTAVSIYAEPDMVIEDEQEADLNEDEEQEDEEQETAPDEAADADNASDGDNNEDNTPEETEDEEGTAPDEDSSEDYPTDDDLLEEEAPSLPEPTYTPTGDVKMYATTTINVRKGPGTGYDKLGVLYAGGETTVKGYNGEWMAIDYYGGTGYVLGELLTETAPVTTTATEAPTETAPEVVETDESPAETEPVIEDTTVTEEEEPVIITTSEETAPTTQPVADDSDDDEKQAAAVTDSSDKKSGGLQGILIAAISALAAFILIGVLPIVIHRIHHKKLYQY